MTKQQAISLKLAQWLGLKEARVERRRGGVAVVFRKNDWHEPIFNPFSSSTDGRAQFAECWEKSQCDITFSIENDGYSFTARMSDRLIDFVVPHKGEGCPRAAYLEAIYYAIGGTADAWNHSSENASPD